MIRHHSRLAAVLGLFAVGAALAPAAPQEPDPFGLKTILDTPAAKPVAPRPLKTTATERLRIARRVLDGTMQRLLSPPSAGESTSAASAPIAEQLLLWLNRETAARLDLAADVKERVEVLNSEYARTAKLVVIIGELAKSAASGVNQLEADKFAYRLLEIEERLAREMAAK